MEVMPAPPGFLAPVQLDGPFDADIPSRQANQIKNASLVSDWAVPYIFLHIGTQFEYAGDERRSVHFLDRAIHEFRKRNNASGEGTAYSRKISALIHFGRLQTAYDVTQELAKKWTGPPYSAFVFYNYAYYHQKNGDYAKAQEYFRQALAQSANHPDEPDFLALRRDAEWRSGINLILADYFSAVSFRLCRLDFDDAFYENIRHNVPEALSHWDQVSELNAKIQKTKVQRFFPEIVPSSMPADVLNYRGLAYGIDGKTPEAVRTLETSAGIARKAGYYLGEADNLFFLNHVYLLDKNRRSEGIRAVKGLAETADRYQMVSYSIWAEMILAYYAKATGDTEQAIKAVDHALKIMEENDSWFLREADVRGIGIFNVQKMYEALLEMHISRGNKQEAFQTSERAKAALLIQQISDAFISKNPAQSADVNKIRDYRKKLTENCRRMLSPVSSSAVFMDRVEALKQTRAKYGQLLAGIQQKDESLYSVFHVAPLEIKDIQHLLDGNTTLFAYFTAEQYLYIWVISKNAFHQEIIKIPRGEVERLADIYRSALMTKDKLKADTLAEKVYDTFLKPVIPFVYGDRIGFVPYGTLYDLPFSSMRYVQSYLVDGFTIFYLPCAGILKHLSAKEATTDEKKALIIFDGTCLQDKQFAGRTAEEMNALKKIFPEADSVAREKSSKNEQPLTGHYEVIHWALRDCLMVDRPSEADLLSFAADPKSGCPEIQDVFRWRLNGQTAVLSPCRAGKSLNSKRSGMSGLTSALLYAVSSRVVTRLWDVEDKAQEVFFGMFYENLKKSGSAADSLRAAQNGMIQSGYGPSDWAAFMLNGRY